MDRWEYNIPEWAGSKTDFGGGGRLCTAWVKQPAWGHLSTLRTAWRPQLLPGRSRSRLPPPAIRPPAPTSSSSSPESDSGSTGTSSSSPMVPMNPSSASMLRKQRLPEGSVVLRPHRPFRRSPYRHAHALYVTSVLRKLSQNATAAWGRGFGC